MSKITLREILDQGELEFLHFNSYRTACQYITEHTIMSRKYLIDNKYDCTEQKSDSIDEELGIDNYNFFDLSPIKMYSNGFLKFNYGLVAFKLKEEYFDKLEYKKNFIITKENPYISKDSVEYFETLDDYLNCFKDNGYSKFHDAENLKHHYMIYCDRIFMSNIDCIYLFENDYYLRKRVSKLVELCKKNGVNYQRIKIDSKNIDFNVDNPRSK